MNVTITGADDGVNHHDLAKLSEEFPFVEWGILFSEKRKGSPRYPSNEWIDGLLAHEIRRTSIHLCGYAARSTMQGSYGWIRSDVFGRTQINGFTPGYVEGLRRIDGASLILQCRREEHLEAVARDAAYLQADVLFDPSGGRGLRRQDRWPSTPPGCRMGFAGGIGPDNVQGVLSELGRREGAWIDMESGVRTDNEFDLSKVRSVLHQVSEFRYDTRRALRPSG